MSNGDPSESYWRPFWPLVAEQAERWRRAANRVLDGTYTADDLIRDALEPWAAWWILWSGGLGSKLAFLSMSQGSDGASTVIPVLAPTSGDPAWSGLTTVDDKTIPASSVQVVLENDRRELRVTLSGLNALPSEHQPVDGDVFRGIVTVGERLIVAMVLRVNPGG